MIWAVIGAFALGAIAGVVGTIAWAFHGFRSPRVRITTGERATDRDHGLWGIACRELGMDYDGRIPKGHPVPPPDPWGLQAW